MPSPQPAIDDARRQAEARTALTTSLSAVGSSLDADLRTRAADLHANAAALTKQQADVARETTALRKETDALLKVADVNAEKLKEVGDVQNWAELIERDLLVLEATLGLVEADDERAEKARKGGVVQAVDGVGPASESSSAGSV